MTIDNSAIEISGLIQVSKWMSVLFASGAALAASVCVLWLRKQPRFTVGQLKLSVSEFPYVAACFTAAHLFLTWVFIQRIDSLRGAGPQVSSDAWKTLTGSAAFVFFNMQARVWEPSSGPFGMGGYFAAPNDTAFWASFAFALLGIAAVALSGLPRRMSAKSRNMRLLSALALGSTVASVNWIIGSRWAIAASSLR
jgi:hypothetical protein